ncbi:hypothetical protein EMCRGX_G002259 [Ephydatia muelleri]
MTDFLGVKLHGVLPWLIFYVGSGPAVVESNSTRTLQRWSVAHCELQNASVMLSLYVGTSVVQSPPMGSNLCDGQGHVVLFEQASNTFYVTVDSTAAITLSHTADHEKVFDRDLEDWASYCERVEQYFIANGISNADRKRPILLSVCGPATFKLIRSLIAPDKPSDKSFEQIVKAVSDHLCPKPSSILQCFYFNSCVQKESESIAQFVAELRRLAVHCEFEGTLEIMLRDRLVCGAVRLPSVPLPVHSVDKKGLSVPDSVSCFRCGGKHYATTCKLKSVTCNNCGKTGHIAKVCRSNPTGAKSSAARQKGKAARGHSPEKENSPPREGSKGHSLYNFSSSSNKLFRVTLQVNGVNLPMEIDTGAAVSILSEATYKGKTAKLDLIVVSNEGPTLLGRACNGAAERAVQTLKEYLSKTRGDLETRLSRFLFQYRLTPHTSTGSSPAELLFGRRPKSHLDFIHPDLSAKVTLQQERQHLASESGASICAFLSGDKVYVRNFSPSTSSSVKWLPGVVTSLAGPRSVRVALEDGTIVLRHFDHVKFRLLPPPHPDQSSTVSTAGPSAQGLETCTTCTSGNSPDAKVSKPLSAPVPTPAQLPKIRRSSPPDRFDAVSVQNVGSTYIIVSWDLPTHSNGILISFSLYCNVALAGVLPLTMISYNTTGLLLFTLYTYMYVFSATALPEISDDVMLDAIQFNSVVEGADVTLPNDALILYEDLVVPLSVVYELALPPKCIAQWDGEHKHFKRFDDQETLLYFMQNPWKFKAAGRKVIMVPSILFSDDTSGNKSKKWHKFESWYLLFAGLPRQANGRHVNIHFVCCSDSVSPLDMARPISEDLARLENEGVEMYDAQSQEKVLVVAPLMLIICDNPRASELANHLGSAANKFCRICVNPYMIDEERTLEKCLVQIEAIRSQPTVQSAKEMQTLYGLRATANPMLEIRVNVYRCESFNATVRAQNIYSNRLSPSRDICHHFAVQQHLRYLCDAPSSGDVRCGDALKRMYLSHMMHNFFNNVPIEEHNAGRSIHHPGALRKLRSKHPQMLKHVNLGLQNDQGVNIQLLHCLPENYVKVFAGIIARDSELVNAGDFVETVSNQFILKQDISILHSAKSHIVRGDRCLKDYGFRLSQARVDSAEDLGLDQKQVAQVLEQGQVSGTPPN